MDIKTFNDKVAARWVSRYKALGLNPTSKKYAEQQLAYFAGAYVAADIINGHDSRAQGILFIALSTGRDSAELFPNFINYIEGVKV